MKNIIFIPNIKLDNSVENGRYQGRSNSYHYSIKSWQNWAKKQNTDIEVIEWTDPIFDPKIFPIIYQREWIFDILEHNNIEYDQILVADADTIVHPNCPNFFKETNHEYSVVVENGCYEWVTRSINGWGHHLFPNETKPKVWEYHNAGFVVMNKKQLDKSKSRN